MIKVLNVISDSNIGGAGRVLINYLENSDRESFRTMIALPKGSLLAAPLRKLGGEVYELDGLAERSYSKEDVKLLEKLIRELKPDIVHTHGALSGRIAGRRCGCKVVYTRHSAFPVPAKLKYPPGRWINKLVNEHYADHIIAVSPAAAENLTDAGISPKLITVMMNGVSPVERRPEEETAAYRESLGIPEDGFVLGILARIEPYKGHMHIIGALDMLRERGKRPFLLIAGSGSFEEELKAEVSRRELDSQVRFLGFLSDVAPFLSALDLQLNASYGTETSSLSILEGLSMGLPAVVSSYGGNPWLIDDGEDGLLFRNRDSRDLADKIDVLMGSPRALGIMGDRAREIFERRFTGRIFAQNVENVYRKVLEGSKNG